MRFAQSYYSFFFWIIFALAIFLLLAWHNRKRTMLKFAEEKLLERIAASVNLQKKMLKLVLIILSFIFLVLALMRPQWGYQWEEVKKKGLDILVAIDVSKSMLASDVKPNRLERSKLAVKDLLKKLKSDRIGLIAFSGTAFLQCPLTVDYNGFLLALNDLDVDTIPRGGTSISSAIKKAILSYEGGEKKYKILVLITDGEDHEGSPIKLARAAKVEGIKIFCIGIGTAEGELIQLKDESGKRIFLKDKQGNIVKSRLDEKVLRKVALTTGGTYVRSSGAEFGLDFIYEEKLAPMERREIKAKLSKFYHERFQIPLSIALILLIIEPWVSERRKG